MSKQTNPGEFQKGDPVWVRFDDGGHYSGFYDKKGNHPDSHWVTALKGRTGGWWVEVRNIAHRYQGDGIEGKTPIEKPEAEPKKDSGESGDPIRW